MQAFSSIPRYFDTNGLRENPLSFLQAAHAAAGDIVVLREDRPVFSRARNCTAVLGVFGSAGVEHVLTGPDLFGTTVSVGEHLSLPSALRPLNAGLFSMTGEKHRVQQQLLRATIGATPTPYVAECVAEGWRVFGLDTKEDSGVALLSEMRRLMLHVACRLVFGDAEPALGKLIQSYFELRRAVSGAPNAPELTQRREIIHTGSQLNRLLRRRLRELRREIASGSASSRRCLMGRLIHAATEQGSELSEDDLVGQANTLFLSSSEPVAVSLTWLLLLLTQQPHLREKLRLELAGADMSKGASLASRENDLPLLWTVIQEALRVFPPNAVMVRLTTRPGQLLAYELPANCEILLSPFVAHRDPREFPEPDVFQPDRWQRCRPPSYAYFPFGVGARFCVGRPLAHCLLLLVSACILDSYEIVLAADQALDWKLNITMMPAPEPTVLFLPRPCKYAPRGGRLTGPLAELVRF